MRVTSLIHRLAPVVACWSGGLIQTNGSA